MKPALYMLPRRDRKLEEFASPLNKTDLENKVPLFKLMVNHNSTFLLSIIPKKPFVIKTFCSGFFVPMGVQTRHENMA